MRPEDTDDEFLTTSMQALTAGPGREALDGLGWWDLLGALDDEDARHATFALFRAQGRTLADSPALGAILAQPYLAHTAIAPGTAVAAIRRQSRRRGPVWVAVGDVAGRHLLFDEPGHGVHIVGPEKVELTAVDVPGRLSVHEVAYEPQAQPLTLDPIVADEARKRSLLLGRVAAASEILGAAEAAVALATEHATNRVQFGQPIGTFQAVRHLLAWATTDTTAIDAVVREGALLLDAPPPHYGEVVKALAGRNGRRACERALQVLGGIGFTAEHGHHHHHSRVLALDSLLGSSAALTHALGTWLRTSGDDPRFAAAVLVPSA